MKSELKAMKEAFSEVTKSMQGMKKSLVEAQRPVNKSNEIKKGMGNLAVSIALGQKFKSVDVKKASSEIPKMWRIAQEEVKKMRGY